MTRIWTRLLAGAALPLLGLAGCAQIDPETREGMWHPVGANAANLRAMVAVPSDLVVGRAARSSDGSRAARAVYRLRTDQTYPLPASGLAGAGGGGGGGATPAASGDGP